MTVKAWTYAWSQDPTDAHAPGELIDLLLGDLQARIENSDPDNADVLYAGPSQTLGERSGPRDYLRACTSVREGLHKAFSVIPVKSERGPWSVIVVCNKSDRTGRTYPLILVATDQENKDFAEATLWRQMVGRAIAEVSHEASAVQGTIGVHGGPTPDGDRSGSWIHTIRVVEELVATYHQKRLKKDCTVRAHGKATTTAEFQARIRAIDDAFGPPGPDRSAAEGVKPLGETFGVTLTEADVESLAGGNPVADAVMVWGTREVRHRHRTANIGICDALLGHDIVGANGATELLTWHRCWAGKGRGPAIDYTKPKFIMMPVRDGTRGWFLIIVCHLTAQRSDKYRPCALILDPCSTRKRAVHTVAVTAISTYMQKWRKCTWGQEQEPLGADWLKVPQTNQTCDTGILVLHMMDLFAQQHDLKRQGGRLAPYGPFGSGEAKDQQTWFRTQGVVEGKGERPVHTKPTLRTRLLHKILADSAGEATPAEKRDDTASTRTERVTSEPGASTYVALRAILDPRVRRMMTDNATGAWRWHERDRRDRQNTATEVKAVRSAIHAALLSTTWGGTGGNRTHALEGRGTFKVYSWTLALCRQTGPKGWAVPDAPATCPVALWVINMALTEGGQYTVAYGGGKSRTTLRLHTQGEVYAFLGSDLDAGRVSLVTQGDTRLVELCVGLAWNEPVTVMPGEQWDDHDPDGLRLVIDQDGPGMYSRERYNLVEGSAQKIRTGKQVCPRCDEKHKNRSDALAHFHRDHMPGADADQAAAIYANEMQVYWEWRRFDAVAQRILHVEGACGIIACCHSVERPAAPRPHCLRRDAERHAEFEGGIKIGSTRRPARYLFRQGIHRQDVMMARSLALSEEGHVRASAIHDISGKLGATVRIIPYADEQSLAYLEGRPKGDARAGCVLREEDTKTDRKTLHENIIATVEALARKVGEPVKLRGYMELLTSKPGAKGQNWHLDVYMGGWNFTWRIQGRPATRFKDIPYQGFPEYLSPNKSTLPANWDAQPDADVVWTTDGDVSMFRADAPHAGPANPSEEPRIAGFLTQDVTEDADDFVITDEILFPKGKGTARLPEDAPTEVHEAWARAQHAQAAK